MHDISLISVCISASSWLINITEGWWTNDDLDLHLCFLPTLHVVIFFGHMVPFLNILKEEHCLFAVFYTALDLLKKWFDDEYFRFPYRVDLDNSFCCKRGAWWCPTKLSHHCRRSMTSLRNWLRQRVFQRVDSSQGKRNSKLHRLNRC